MGKYQAHFAQHLDTPLPDELFVGKGTMLHLKGWCYSSNGSIQSLEVVAGDQVIPIPNHSWARADVFAEQFPDSDKSGYSLLSGFEGFLPFSSVGEIADVTLRLRAVLTGGAVVERTLGSLRLLPGYGAVPTAVTWPSVGPRVAICMATFNPPYELFREQIKSLKLQTHRNWVCIINDDGTRPELYDKVRYLVKGDTRFFFTQNKTRQNFYVNFQESLKRAPNDAEFIALCDQDDVWYPDKLETLLAGFHDDVQLVYSDAKVVTEGGHVQSESFWVNRRNNYTDLSALMVANTITGASSIFRATLLQEIMPFPKPIGHVFHDHWIGLVALFKGKINYIDRPLYDYIQHAEGVIGHNYNEWSGLKSAARDMLRALPRRKEMAGRAAIFMKQSLADYQFVLQKVMFARTLLLRNPGAAALKRTAVQRFAQFETSVRAALLEKIAAVRAHRPTLNLEGMFLWAIMGTRLRNYAFRYKRKALLRLQTERPGARLLEAVVSGDTQNLNMEVKGGSRLPTSALQTAATRVSIPVLEFGSTKWIHHNISPLVLDISGSTPKRVNVLLATIDFKYVFGGYIGMFNLALRLHREGYRVRIILHEQTDWDMENWRQQIQKYPGITDLFDSIEIISRFDRSIPVDVNPDDRFVATNCWAAHVAHTTVQHLNYRKFLFMIQEYEPYFLSMNSISALFQYSYKLPQFSLFSTEMLQDFFKQERIGVFAAPEGEKDAAVFTNAIQKFYPTRQQLLRSKRRLLFYARPEEHAARNLFELGMIALAMLVRDPRVDLNIWSFHGIGSIDRQHTLDLAPNVPLELVPKTSLQEYIDLLPSFDVGLSLMLTPHPSLVPLEMASAGMLTVTNTFANKTAERLRNLSANLIGVEPTISALRDALIDAMLRADQIDRRLEGSHVRWPTDWDSSFPQETLQRIREFLGAP